MNYLDPWAWRSNMDAPQPSPNALAQPVLKEGPAPTGFDRMYDAIYGWLGGRPEQRGMANALAQAADVGTLGMLSGAYDGGRELAQTGSPALLAMSLLPGAKVGKAAGSAAGKAATEGIRAYHGSPHSFDRFDLSKIGTGEGAQAYGHGLYFAENEAVAKGYRDRLGAKDWHKTDDWAKIAFSDIQYVNGNVEAAVASWKETIARAPPSSRGYNAAVRKLAAYESGEVARLKPGSMYEVRINASPDDFLDWDRPLSEQSENVRAALSSNRLMGEKPVTYTQSGRWHNLRSGDVEMSLGEVPGGFREMTNGGPVGPVFKTLDEAKAAIQRIGSTSLQDARPQTLMTKMGKGVYGGEEAAKALRDAGIPGIRYFDQGSRGAGEGSRNYVVFDDALIEIMRKYGLLPPLAAGGAAAVQSDPAMATP